MSFQVEPRVGFQVGQRAGNYEFLEVLSSATNEIAYRVRNHLTQRVEALKVLSSDADDDRESVERFLREIKVHARLVHPNIVTFYNAAELEGQLVMTLELVDGITLAERFRQMGALPWVEAVSHIDQVLQALGFAHQQGIIHRNVTPESIIVTADATVKLNGFDLAKPMASPGVTQTGSVMGVLRYIPPEQIRGLGPLDARSDLYSVGVVLYEALTGALPFDSDSQFQVMMGHVSAAPPAPSSVNPHSPPEFDSLVLKALAKDPADRFQSADEFRARLVAVRNNLRMKSGAPIAVGSVPGYASCVTEPDVAVEEQSSTPLAAPEASGEIQESQAVADIPSFGILTAGGTGRNNLLLMLLGLSSLLIGVAIALLLAAARL